MNSTNEEENIIITNVSQICYQYIGPAICVFGIVSNILNLLILTERSLKVSPYSYLTAMAVTDLSALCQAFLFMVFSQNKPNNYHWRFYDAHIFYPLVNICTNSSVWLIVLLTVERFLFVRFPFWAKIHLNRKGTHIKIGLIILSMFIINIPKFFTFTVKYNAEKDTYHLNSQEFRHSQFNFIINWFHSTVINFIPLTILCLSNIYLLVAVQQIKSNHRLLTNQNNNKTTWHRDQMRLTITLISIVCLFIICIMPNAFADRPVAYALFAKEGQPIGEFVKSSTYLILQLVSNLLLWCNLSLNFVLYCAFNTKFVQVFKKMINRWAKKLHERTEAMNSNYQIGEMNSSEISNAHRQTQNICVTRSI